MLRSETNAVFNPIRRIGLSDCHRYHILHRYVADLLPLRTVHSNYIYLNLMKPTPGDFAIGDNCPSYLTPDFTILLGDILDLDFPKLVAISGDKIVW